MNTDASVKTRQRIIIVTLIVALLLTVIIAFIAYSSAHKQIPAVNIPTPTSKLVRDPATGRTYLQQTGIQPEPEVQNDTATFSGFGSELLNMGVTTDQINGLQRAFQLYKPFAHTSAQIILSTDDLQKVFPDKNDPQYRWSITSHVDVIGIGTYHIKFYYAGTSTIELLIYDKTGSTLLFDSGAIDGTS